MSEEGIAVREEQEAAGPGIVVFSSSFELLHMNRRARTLLTELEQPGPHIRTAHPITAPLHPHYQDMIQTMQARLAANNWERFYQYCLIGPATKPILLKAFGLPDRRDEAHYRIVMLLTPHNPLSTPTFGGAESTGKAHEQDRLDADSPHVSGQ